MKKKIFVILFTLILTTTVLNIPKGINVIATSNDGDPDLDHKYIIDKTHDLANITFYDDYHDWGRFFGTPGEREAARKIEIWMNDTGLDCVHNETINSYWDENDEHCNKIGSLYIGELNKSRKMSENFFLNISVYDSVLGLNLLDYRNLTIGECSPYYQHMMKIFNKNYKSDYGMAIVVEEFIPILPVPQIELCNTHYADSYTWHNKSDWGFIWRYKGFIAIDNSTNSFFQCPPVYDQNHWLGWNESQGIYVNGSIGEWIRENLNYHVVATYGTYWEYEDVVSYNVIGQINGSDNSNKTNIVCAHYDGMPGQATIDEGAETALVLGIAKYIKDHELESDLKYTVKFIAFGAEEVGIRGAKDYIKKHNETEDFIYVVNPGNFGSYDRIGIDFNGKNITMPFEPASDRPWLVNLSEDIANALDYTQRTSETGNGSIEVKPLYRLRAEDSQQFGVKKKDGFAYADGCIQFGRGPFSGYHRDGENHTTGDIYEGLDVETFNLECEVVASVALHLFLNLDYQYENCTFIPVDLDGDGYNDSVNVTVNMSTNNNATLLGNTIGGLYNSTTGSLSSAIEDTTLIPLSKGYITTANLTLTLKPDKPVGNYTANLSLFDPLDELHEECNQTFYLYPIIKPYADFTFEPPSGGKSFDFTDESIPSPNANEISSWNWSFGDGTYSELQNPSHTYENKDSYDVTLTVVDDQSLTDDITKTIITDNDNPDADFNMNTNVQLANTAVTFTSTSSDNDGDIVSTKWCFGDGTTGYGNSVQHSYSRCDKYTVTMEVTDNDDCVSTTSDVIYITGAFVDDSYPGDSAPEHKWDTIQEGIDDVRDNELVYVFNGEYTNSVTVDKPISIYGEEGGNTFINNPFSTAIGVVVANDNTVIDGFTIENNNIGIRINGLNNTIISNCNILNTTMGVKIENNAEGNMIMHCNFTNNSYGVYITGSEYNVVGSLSDMEQPVLADCMFLLNDYGVYLEDANNNYILGCTINATGVSDPRLPPPSTWGICFDNSDNNTAALCDVFGASQYGMYLSGSINNSISNSIIRENIRGIYLSGSSYNSIVENNISESSFAGVSIVTMSSTGNSVFWNDFIRNGIITGVQAEDFGTGNNWNASENVTYLYNGSGEGNQWDDYTGTDNNGDHIGDTAYSIAGTANSEDDYPVMEEYGWMYEWF